MLRDVGLEDISDGRLYRENDMVKTDTNSCQGCKKICCIGMGRTIVLDPYDCYRLGIGTGKTFEQLLDTNIELNMVDGCILILKCRQLVMAVHFLELITDVQYIITDLAYAECFR